MTKRKIKDCDNCGNYACTDCVLTGVKYKLWEPRKKEKRVTVYLCPELNECYFVEKCIHDPDECIYISKGHINKKDCNREFFVTPKDGGK